MEKFATFAERNAIEAEAPWEEVERPKTIYEFLGKTAEKHGDRPAISFQLMSGPKDPAETLSWRELLFKATQTANFFRDLGVGEKDVVAFLLPNSNETVFTLLGGSIAGIVSPINPLLEADQIAAILRETGAKVLVTLRSFPKTDVAQKAAAAVALAPNVKSVVEIDLLRYLTRERRCIIPATGFYEWTKTPEGTRLPWYISDSSGNTTAFAGIWQDWEHEGERLRTTAIVTIAANEMMSKIHKRMPVTLEHSDWANWLGEEGNGASRLMQPAPEDRFSACRVGTEVNSNRSSGAQLIAKT